MLEAILNLSPDEKVRIEEHIGPLKSVTEFCSDLLEATKEIPLKDKLTLLLPWAAKGGKIVGEVTPLAHDQFIKVQEYQVRLWADLTPLPNQFISR